MLNLRGENNMKTILLFLAIVLLQGCATTNNPQLSGTQGLYEIRTDSKGEDVKLPEHVTKLNQLTFDKSTRIN
jgi:uncharacterized protein YceK